MEYLNKMTVKELREIGERMGLLFQVRAKKAFIVETLSEKIHGLIDEAAEMNENLVKDDEFMYAGVLWTGPWAMVLKAHDKMLRRFNPEMTRDKNGMVKLTPKQRRRVHKNDRRNSKRFGLEKAA